MQPVGRLASTGSSSASNPNPGNPASSDTCRRLNRSSVIRRDHPLAFTLQARTRETSCTTPLTVEQSGELDKHDSAVAPTHAVPPASAAWSATVGVQEAPLTPGAGGTLFSYVDTCC